MVVSATVCVAFVYCMLCRVLRLKHVAIINRINPLLCLLIHFPYEFKPSCFFRPFKPQNSLWILKTRYLEFFSVYSHCLALRQNAYTFSLHLSFLPLILLIISRTLFSFMSSFHSHTLTLHLVTRTSACAFYTYIMHQSKPKRKRHEKVERD